MEAKLETSGSNMLSYFIPSDMQAGDGRSAFDLRNHGSWKEEPEQNSDLAQTHKGEGLLRTIKYLNLWESDAHRSLRGGGLALLSGGKGGGNCGDLWHWGDRGEGGLQQQSVESGK
jgi:hypothetical protein